MANSKYTDDSIKNIPWYEYIRIRPGVYVGDVGTPDEAYSGIYFLFKEVVDNGIDEHLMGVGNTIEISLDHETNSISIRDYGRGIPLNSVKKAACTLHTGAKFDSDAFQKTTGTHGIGIKAVNALSSDFEVVSYRDGSFASVHTRKGRVTQENSGNAKEKNGVRVTFAPDKEIFQYQDEDTGEKKFCLFKDEILEQMIRYYCYLNPNLTIVFNGREFHEKNGLTALLLDTPEAKAAQPMYTPICIKEEGQIELLFTHVGTNIPAAIYGFTNGQYNPLGGTHVTALKTALGKFATDFFEGKQVEGRDIFAGFVCVMNIRVNSPSFESQTKIKLSSLKLDKDGITIQAYLQNLLKKQLTTELVKQTAVANTILARMRQAAKFRKDVQNISAKAKNTQNGARIYNKKLSDCNVHYNSKHAKKDLTSIFLTEGDSAGGNLVQVRDVATQAVFYLRGKPKNSFAESYKQMLEHDELNLLVQALGVTPDNLSGLRYNKIIFATDADDDGLHIRLLLLTFVLKYFPELVHDGHVYILQTPLFRIRDKKKTLYAYDQKELQDAIKKTASNREITRFKGLGEISPNEFKQFIGENIRLDQVTLADGFDYMDTLKFYMGGNSPEKEKFVVDNFTQAPEFSGDTSVDTIFKENYAKYSSYVNLERSLPDFTDGLKPVQRRILHVMKLEENGSYNKAAAVVGECMKYHPHGDSSIAEALVGVAQKNYLIDAQGNWGHPLKGLGAAAPRYIECRLSKLAKDILYSEPATEYTDTYDGKRKEPVSIPCKLPLVLLQGVQGIGVSMACMTLPHNFNEVVDASIACLRNKPFSLYPDFQFGGLIDVREYKDGARGGKVTIRARIEKQSARKLVVTEIPFSTKTDTVCESIKDAIDDGKLNITSIRDNSTEKCHIELQVAPDADIDREIAALYSFTQCQVKITTNPKVTVDNSVFAPTVSEMLKKSVEVTKSIIQKELEAELQKYREQILALTLEKIYIENRYYRKTEELSDYGEILITIEESLAPHVQSNPDIYRALTSDDYERLTEIKLIRITKYDSNKAEDKILALQKDAAGVESKLSNLTKTTIAWYTKIKSTYGELYPRKTEITEFSEEKITQQKRKAAEQDWYISRSEGLVYAEPADGRVAVDKCAKGDRFFGLSKSGNLIVRPLVSPTYIGTDLVAYGNLEHESEEIYDLLYRDNNSGLFRIKRFKWGGIRSNTELKLVGENSTILFCQKEPQDEAYKVKITFKPASRLRVLSREIRFADLLIKGRNAQGNLIDTYTGTRDMEALEILGTEPANRPTESQDSSPNEQAEMPQGTPTQGELPL